MPQLNHQIRGQGQPLILIHGLFGSLENLGMVAKPLAEHFKVISVDVRNHGSSFHENNMDYDLLAQDIIALMDDLAIDSAHILGHSMGGKIAMQVALNHSERVKKLIVADIAPVQYPAHHQKIIEGLLSLNFDQITSRKAADEHLAQYVETTSVRQFLLRNLSSNNATLSFKCNVSNIANCYQQIMDSYHGNNRFEKPTLFIKGGNSDYITAEHREIIGKLFPNTSAKIIAGAGHWLHAEKPVAFNKIVLDFLTA